MKVPLFNAQKQFETLRVELMDAAERVLASGGYILGPEVEAFEQEVAGFLDVRHAIGVASGTDALWLSLKALGVGAGDRVLTTSFTFFATASAICNCGAQPVFVDIEPRTFNMDPNLVRQVLEGRSPRHKQLGIESNQIKAIIPVHLYGQSAAMAELMALSEQYGIPVVEDAAQALGAFYRGQRTGTFGRLACLSFFPTKNLGAYGDAGLVVTQDGDLAEKVRALRAHGSRRRYDHRVIGTNSRLDELQAALLRTKLARLDEWITGRQGHAAFYDGVMNNLTGILTPYRAPDCSHTYHQYSVRVSNERRDSLKSFLAQHGVESRVYYPSPLHMQRALHHLGYREGDFPAAEQASREALSLPIFPELTGAEREYVAIRIGEFFGSEN